MPPPRRAPKGRRWLAAIAASGLIVFLRGALFSAQAPHITIDATHPAIGASNQVSAMFAAPIHGLGEVKLELIQGDQQADLGQARFDQPSAYGWSRQSATREHRLQAPVGRKHQNWLKAGPATLRATATRWGGLFRSASPVVVERTFQVRLRPPQLAVISTQHYVRQGGSGVVVYQASSDATRSGVRVGEHLFEGFAHPRIPDAKYALFGVPWDVRDGAALRVFAEDDAGNRIELPFVSVFKPYPPRPDTITINDSFLQTNIPAIAAQIPGFDGTRPLLDQYLEINGALRRANLGSIVELSSRSAAEPLWHGAFLQLANSARKAGYAERRTYVYQGRSIDQQTHLGLDLASTEKASVPAANSGRVVLAEFFGIYGNTVIIDHGLGLFSLNGHLSSISVARGDSVQKGQTVGTSGATGLAGGDHLHLEIFVRGVSVDPVEWLDAHWIEDNILRRLAPSTR
jgi:murein DD-endopeptidase MepM/ murein hydrolase activator NlpD